LPRRAIARLDVIDRIRGLMNKAPARKEHLEINGLIRDVIELVRGDAVKSGVSVQTELVKGLPLIQGDRVQIQQVLLNLIINAFDAMTVNEEARELLISSGKSEKGGVRVAVRDSGPGLGEADLERVFESFYTTKSDGMGLGLAICRSTIEAHRLQQPNAGQFRPGESGDDAPAGTAQTRRRRCPGRRS
jgi:signal transduction histidine kinase